MTAYLLVWIRIECVGERGHGGAVECVPERDRCIAPEHGATAPTHRRRCEATLEGAASQVQEREERWRGDDVVDRRESRSTVRTRTLGRRARILTEVAAPDPIADQRPQLARNRIGALREIGDAAARIDRVVSA